LRTAGFKTLIKFNASLEPDSEWILLNDGPRFVFYLIFTEITKF